MRRRRRTELPGYDSILDMMTNVVGVLIIVVIATQLSVSESAKAARTMEASQEVTEEALEVARAEQATIIALLEKVQKRWGGLELNAADWEIEVQDLQRAIDILKGEVVFPTHVVEDIAHLLLRLDEVRKRLNELEGKRNEARTEFASVSAKAAAPSSEANELSLPDPNPAGAEGRNVKWFFCKRGEIFEFPVEELVGLSFEGRREAAKREAAKRASAVSWDGFLRGTSEYFEGRDIGTKNFRIKGVRINLLSVIPTDGEKETEMGNIERQFKLRVGARGVSIEGLLKRDNNYADQLRVLDPKDTWFYFYVFDDSFEIYLAARRLAIEAGYPVGWSAYGENESVGGYFFPTGSESGISLSPDS